MHRWLATHGAKYARLKPIYPNLRIWAPKSRVDLSRRAWWIKGLGEQNWRFWRVVPTKGVFFSRRA